MGLSNFKPFGLFKSCHTQTIVASLLTFYPDLLSYRRFVHFSDGERIALEVTTPPNWKPEDPTVVMVHGFCGSHQSPYLVRIVNTLYKHGVRSIRINLRGCGSSKGYSKKLYHPDCSEDIWKALLEIQRDTPHSKLTLLGYSLGGNVLLKMAGERKTEVKNLVEKLIVINPSIDMYSSAKRLSENFFYQRFFMKHLKKHVYDMHNSRDDLPPIIIPSKMGLLEFNEFYIAPQAGYLSAQEYYYAASSGRLILDIEVKTHILFASDDPIIDCLTLKPITLPKNIKMVISKRGGHLGYLGSFDQKGGVYWMDSIILHWFFNDKES